MKTSRVASISIQAFPTLRKSDRLQLAVLNEIADGERFIQEATTTTDGTDFISHLVSALQDLKTKLTPAGFQN